MCLFLASSSARPQAAALRDLRPRVLEAHPGEELLDVADARDVRPEVGDLGRRLHEGVEQDGARLVRDAHPREDRVRAVRPGPDLGWHGFSVTREPSPVRHHRQQH